MDIKLVDSKVYPLSILFKDKFDVDFYQREYVWQKKQLEDLINDLSNEFLKNWNENDNLTYSSAFSYSTYSCTSVPYSSHMHRCLRCGTHKADKHCPRAEA